MKKLLLGLGAVAAVAAPIATVVACGDNSTPPKTNPPVEKQQVTTQAPAKTPVTETLTTNIKGLTDIGNKNLEQLLTLPKTSTKVEALAKVDTSTGTDIQKSAVKNVINHYPT